MYFFLLASGLMAVIAIGLFVSSKVVVDSRDEAFNYRFVSIVFFCLAFASFIVSTFAIVQPGHVGIQILLGNVSKHSLDSGFHMINPLKRVEEMSIRTEIYDVKDAACLSSNNLNVEIDLTVRYHILPATAVKIFKEIGTNYVKKIIEPSARTAVRDVAAKFKATDILSSHREQVRQKIDDILAKDFKKKGLELEKVQLRHIAPPRKVKDAIEAKLSAEQEAQKMEFVIQKAKKQAEVRKIEAGGIAEAQSIINKTLTRLYLQHEAIQAYRELAESKNTTFIIMPTNPKGAGMPIIIDGKGK